MRTKIVTIIAFISLGILVVIQSFLISNLYKLKKNEFDSKYHGLISNAIGELQNIYYTNGFDSVFLQFDQEAYKILDSIHLVSSTDTLSEVQDKVLSHFLGIISEKELLSPFIRFYLEQNNAESDFNSGYIIRKLVIFDIISNYIIYDEENERETKSGDKVLSEFKNSLQVNSYNAEGNYYNILFDFYIDFTHKTRVIYREMTGMLILTFVSIIIVGAVFIYTIQNMMKQKKLSDLKTDFINNMTHELKTPLTTISVASSSLENDKIYADKSRVMEISRLIGKQNNHLSHLIDHILDINIWEKDQITIQKNRVDVIPFIKEKIDAFKINNTNNNISINEEYELQEPVAEFDEFQITMVLNNILSNSVKYNLNKPEIFIKVFGENNLVISISDNGIGLGKEEQENIFSKFYRANTGDLHNVKGLGLGLFYVKKIIDLHNGSIEVKSKPGKGSTFIITLPVKQINK